MPASCISSPSRSAVSGVSSAGLRIVVLPQASAGASFQAAISRGKFHGTINPTTPIGSRSVYTNWSGTVTGMVLPSILPAQPA